LDPGSPLYNEPVLLLRFAGFLDESTLQQALGEILRRHEVLRTTFTEKNGKPYQVIHPLVNLPLCHIDLQALSESEQEAEVDRLALEEAWHPFDLRQGPLFRATLLRLEEERHVLLIARHHIVFDGGSLGILIQELVSHYDAFVHGSPSPLPDLEIQYADFALWQKKWVEKNVQEAQLAYWKERLKKPPEIQLLSDAPISPIRDYEGGRESVVLGQSLVESLENLSRQQESTLFMTLLAAFQVLLFRWSGQEDIIIGTPIARRDRMEVQPLIGYFLNTLVLRTDLGRNPNFLELLKRVRGTALSAYAHQDLPFGKLVETLKPERCPGRNPFFDVWINFREVPRGARKFGDLSISEIKLIEPISKFWMTLYIEEHDDGFHLELVYQRAMFSQASMVGFLAQLEFLLEQIVADPQKPIDSYSLVTAKAKRFLPDPSVPLAPPKQDLVMAMFSDCKAQFPTHPAVCQNQRVWTYEELDTRVQGLAETLARRGLQKGEVVGLLGPSSFGLIVSMMAVLLRGGIFLTLDSNLPLHRLLIMVREARSRHLVLIGDHPLEEMSFQEANFQTVTRVSSFEGLPENVDEGRQAQTLPQVDPEDPAYIFFTSGTTGMPKGVLGSHKGLSHFVNWERETFSVGPHDRVAQLIGLSFDALLRDVFVPLTSGAALCLPDDSDGIGSYRVFSWLEKERISIAHTVPSLAYSWLDDHTTGLTLRTLRCLFFAGEPLTGVFVRRWREAFPESGVIINLYGPTETTMVKCFFMVPQEIPQGMLPGGKPLPDTQVLVLSGHNTLCGPGEVGEIVLRTPFRTLGYINGSADNDAPFVNNPFRNDPQDLIYRTGDRGRYRPDGLMEVLGRMDHQVKIHGVRVELDEISAVLEQHQSVQSAVVLAREDKPGLIRLVAYICLPGDHTLPSVQLRDFLRERLPLTMIPSIFVVLETLPLTPSGKVDRRALPVPDEQDGSQKEVGSVPPRTEMERLLAEIWCEELGIEEVSVYDNFFDLGGHSLLSIKVIARLEDLLGWSLNPREFLYQSLGQVAVTCETRKAEGCPSKRSSSIWRRFVGMMGR